MDASRNLIDLKYLVNPMFSSILDANDQKIGILRNEDIQNYKRRIFLLTKKFLKGERTQDVHINTIFDWYASQCIEYFKFNDKKTIIQEDYKDLNTKNQKEDVIPVGTDPNNFIMRKPHQHIPKITDHINITTTHAKKKKIIIPKVRDLQNKKFKRKKGDKHKKK